MNKQKKDEVVRQVIDTSQKAILSFIPAGPILDGFLNFSNNLRTMRVIDFSEKLKETLEKYHSEELTSESINSEVLVDIIHSIFSKIVINSSSFKSEKFRNIIVNQITHPVESDHLNLKYIEILESLNEIQLVLLIKFRENGYTIEEIDKIHWLIDSRNDKGSKEYYSDYNTHVKIGDKTIVVPESDIELYTEDLISKGLLNRNIKEEKASDYDKLVLKGIQTKIKTKIRIALSGIKFLDFIELGEMREPPSRKMRI